THADLRDADLVLLNEADVGMARSGNRDVAADLGRALGFHTAWAPLFLETTSGRDDDPASAGGRENEEALFGLGMLSRFPIGAARVIELPSPQALTFDGQGMYGRYIALAAAIERPGAPFVAVTTHLDVHRTRAHRADQMRALMESLRAERRPIVLAGDFNTSTFDRGVWHSRLLGAVALILWPGAGWVGPPAAPTRRASLFRRAREQPLRHGGDRVRRGSRDDELGLRAGVARVAGLRERRREQQSHHPVARKGPNQRVEIIA